MSICEKITEQMVEALYGELSADARTEFDAHIAGCAECRKQFQSFRDTLRLMDRRERTAADEPSLDTLWERIERDMDSDQPHASTSLRPYSMIRLPRWIYQAAAAVLLIVCGILIGRFLNAPGGDLSPGSALVSSESAEAEALIRQTASYLSRSRVLLLGITNIDTSDPEVLKSLDLSVERRLSNSMAAEAAVLKTALGDHRQQRLAELVADLEVILIQIANLEAQTDAGSVELLRAGVEQNGILFKINLEEMHRYKQPAESKPAPSI